MYLHIGQDTVLKHDDIIGIFDIETTSISKITRNYLKNAQNENRVITITKELPKSFIVCDSSKHKKGNYSVYISQISSTTLLKRFGFIDELNSEI